MIVAGFGFRAAATAASLEDALARAADGRAVSALAAPDDKAAAACFETFARARGLPVLPVRAAAIAAAETSTRSPHVEAARGTGSVAEASALAAAGPGARLVAARCISEDRFAACAIAEAGGAGDRS